MAALILSATILTSAGYALTARKPLSKSEIIELLQNEVPPTRVEELARKYGISFEVSPEAEKQLREAGATEALLNALRELAPRPSPPTPAPAVLSIEATPGGAQVSVDDEAVGTTSAEGRLKLSRLAPGEHRLRLSREGYQDFEQKVTLAAGEAVRIIAKLEAVKPAAPESPPAPSGKPEATSTGTLRGISVQNLTPSIREQLGLPTNVRGVVISDMDPDSPAVQAGLQPGDVIQSINRQPVSSVADYNRLAAKAKGEVLLHVNRQGNSAYVLISPDAGR